MERLEGLQLVAKQVFCFICCLKELSLAESTLTTAKTQVDARVSNASSAANTTKVAWQDADQLESDAKAVSLEELDGK